MNEENNHEVEIDSSQNSSPNNGVGKPDTLKDTLIQILIFLVIVGISLTGFILLAQTTMLIASIADTIILVIITFICVKAFKSKKTILAILLIVYIAPMILILLLFGACAFLMTGGGF